MPYDVNSGATPPAGLGPQVSILISVYNGERYLREALESVISQDFKDFEVVIINDGSTDRTGNILAEYAVDQRFRIINQESRGLVYSLNRGLQEARAELIARLDADDVALPQRLTRQVDYMRAHPEVALLGTAITVIDKKGQKVKDHLYPTGSDQVKSAMSRFCAVSHPSVMMRRSRILELGGYRSAFLHAEDFDLWLRLSERYLIDNLTEPLILYRQHDENVSRRFQQQQSLSAIVAIRCSEIRRTGQADPMSGKEAPVSPLDLARLDLSESEEAQILFESIKNALNNKDQVFDPEFLRESLTRAWELRSHLHRGRMVRRCLIPGSAAFRGVGYGEDAKKWVSRAFGIDPVNAFWALLRMAFTSRQR